MIALLVGDADTSIDVQIVDDEGLPVTGLIASTFPTVKYSKGAGADATISLSDLSALTDAHSDGGVFERDGGYYRLDLPDAVATAAAPKITVRGEATDKRIICPPICVKSATRGFTGTAVPAAAADAPNGLVISYAGGLNIDQMRDSLIIRSGSVTAAFGATSSEFATNLTDGNDFWVGAILRFTSGSLAGQSRIISAYAQTTGQCNFTVPFSTNPSTDDTFVIVPIVNYISGFLSEAIASGVWESFVANHQNEGTMGQALGLAAAAGDPWATSLPGAYTDDQAGKVLSDALEIVRTSGVMLSSATLSSIATAVLDLSNGIEAGVTPRQALRAIAAVIAGLISDAGTGTETFKGIGQAADGTTRVTNTVDEDGNRSATTLNL